MQPRRAFITTLAGATAMMGFGHIARAASFPDKPIKILLGYPAGGTTDSILRLVAQHASGFLGRPVLIENRPGAGSTISLLAARAARAAAADGYTLSISTTSAFSTPLVVESAYDPLKDSTYIIRLTNVTLGVVVRQDSPFKTWEDLMKFARANPGKAAYGAPGVAGNLGHLAMEAVAEKERIELPMVAFKGSADLQQALLGGHVVFATDGSGAFEPMVSNRRERLLAVLPGSRVPLWPDVPTLKELGYPVAFDSPWGLVGPPGMDPAVVRALHDAFKKALETREVHDRIVSAGQGDYYLGPAEYTRYAAQEAALQRTLLERVGLLHKR